MEQVIFQVSPPAPFTKEQLPVINFKHILGLTDLTGIMQHALFTLPNRKEGYCIDDNSRALLWALWAGREKANKTAIELLPVYLSFIHYMQSDDGYFRNFMSYNKQILEKRGSEDSFGRTMMAMGFLINESPTHLLARIGSEIFSKAYPHVSHLTSLRGIAGTIIGISQYIKFHYPDDKKCEMVIALADKLVKQYEDNRDPDWHWFETVLTYDNAMLPLALLNAYEITQEENYYLVAMESMHFLESKVFIEDVLRPIGNQGWYKKGGTSARFDQQGVDVMAMVLFYQQAYRVTREEQYLSLMHKSYQWFLGSNDLGMPLYDNTTGGCADGLHHEGINLNQGAESTLAYWISHIVVAESLKA